MNILTLDVQKEIINGKEVAYLIDKEGSYIFNKGNLLYGYSTKDILNRYKKLNKEDKKPVRVKLDVKKALATAISFEKEIELRDASERILKEFDVLHKYLPEEKEKLDYIENYFRQIFKDESDSISDVEISAGSLS